MKLSEFIRRIQPEEEGGRGIEGNWIVLAGGVEVECRATGDDLYEILGEQGGWDDGLHMLVHLIEIGAIPDFEIVASA